MAEQYSFREVRKNERDLVLTFAASCGLSASKDSLRHHLSLVVSGGEDEIIAAALCIQDDEQRLVVQIVTNEQSLDTELAYELADRCLRKVQGSAIGSARVISPTREPAEEILSHASWLDTIQETPPQNADEQPGSSPQAA